MNMEQPKFRPEMRKDDLHEGEIHMPHQTMEEYREALSDREGEPEEIHMPHQTMEQYREALAVDAKSRSIMEQLADVRARLFGTEKHLRHRAPEEQ